MSDEGVCRAALATPGLLITLQLFNQTAFDSMLYTYSMFGIFNLYLISKAMI